MNAEEIENLRELLLIYKKRLHFLELKAAKYGVDCPAHVLIEIDDVNDEIEKFERHILLESTMYYDGKNALKKFRYDIEKVEHNLSKVEIKEERTYRLFGIPVWTVSVVISQVIQLTFIMLSVGSIAVLLGFATLTLFRSPSPPPSYPSPFPLTPTDKPLSIPIEQKGETLVIIASFYGVGGLDRDIHSYMRQSIRRTAETAGVSNIRVEIVASGQIADDLAKAEQLGAIYDATIVIWGEDTGMEVFARFLNRRQPGSQAVDVDTRRSQIASPGGYAKFVTSDLPDTMAFFALFAVGQSAYARQDYPTATRIVSNALDVARGITPIPQGTADVYAFRALLYVKLDEMDKALADYTQALALDPKNANFYIGRGNVYRDMGILDKALADYSQALALDPKNANSYIGRGNIYLARGEQDKALADYSQALTLDPANANSYIGRGNIYLARGEQDKALADYTQAIALDPANANAYYDRGLIYQQRGERSAAITEFQKARNLFQNPQYIQDARDRLKELGVGE